MQRLELFGQSGNLLQSANNQNRRGPLPSCEVIVPEGSSSLYPIPLINHSPGRMWGRESAGDHAIPVGPVIKVYALGSSPDGFS